MQSNDDLINIDSANRDVADSNPANKEPVSKDYANRGSVNTDLASKIELAAKTVDNQRVISLAKSLDLARSFQRSLRDIELSALSMGVAPLRYIRNLGTVGVEGQIKLLGSTVAIIGAGGLGGYVVEGLARLGLGRLVIVDCDVFEEHNLNRQIFCTENALGLPKTEVARGRVAAINSAVEVVTYQLRATADNMAGLLQEANVVVDALDTLPARMALMQAARRQGIPLVHGAIAGHMAQIMTIFPEDKGLETIYGTSGFPEKGVETTLGNPATTPMLCAAFQVQEVVKILLGCGEPLRNRLLCVDVESGAADTITLAPIGSHNTGSPDND